MPRPKSTLIALTDTACTELHLTTRKIVGGGNCATSGEICRCKNKQVLQRARITADEMNISSIIDKTHMVTEVTGDGYTSEKLQSKIEYFEPIEDQSRGIKIRESSRIRKLKDVEHDFEDDATICAPIEIEIGVGTAGQLSGGPQEESDKQREQVYLLSELDLPNVSSGPSIGFTAIERSGEKCLREAIEVLQSKEDKLNWHSKKPITWLSVDPTREDFNVVILDEKVQKAENPERRCLMLSEPRRMQWDWCEELQMGENSLFKESSRIFKKMVLANTLHNNVVVPNVFDTVWQLDDFSIFRSSNEEELQQLLLPIGLVRRDDARINEAPSKIVFHATRYLRSLQQSDISLTQASINMPSVWNLEVTKEKLADLIAEELPTTLLQPPSPVSRSSQHEITAPRNEKVSVPHTKSPPSQRTQICSDCKIANSNIDQPSATTVKLKIIAEDNPLSTDYLMSSSFLQCDWSKSPRSGSVSSVFLRDEAASDDLDGSFSYEQFLGRIARPALWDLMRKKMIQVDGTSFQSVFNCINLEMLEAIIYNQFQIVKKMYTNPSGYPSVEIVEACVSLRQACWLHTLRIVLISQKMATDQNKALMRAILAKIVSSAKYKLVLGSSNWKDLLSFLQAIGESSMPSDSSVKFASVTNEVEKDFTILPPPKKQKVLPTEQEKMPVRVICSIKFLNQDEIIDELCTEHQVFFIERELPLPIDILVDEGNSICVLTEDIFEAEGKMRNFIYSLARTQNQFEKCSLIIAITRTSPLAEAETMMTLLFSALVQFRIKIQVFTSFSCEEVGYLVRAIIDECADVALRKHRILPRVWYERSFLLEEESQFERFLVSTRIVSHYAAQSLLNKICLEDMFSKRFFTGRTIDAALAVCLYIICNKYNAIITQYAF
ncbi:hypothetical protein CCR75_002322 [Bremia lactucae]|uniref:Uncharacterized protein n=1 Tax=Bremia lactucae TaxID=4779 RepID=A0A976IKT5_BRELC|nr:hypothetical protein CCR75_002322 [Bremia lactucae]